MEGGGELGSIGDSAQDTGSKEEGLDFTFTHNHN